MRSLLVALTAVGLFAAAPAEARDDTVYITIRVVDDGGRYIPNALVRHSNTEGRREVDAKNGVWTANMLYTPDGDELHFKKGMVIDFVISAPGYVSKAGTYRVRRARNTITVALDEMAVPDAQVDEDAFIRFTRNEHEGAAPSDDVYKPDSGK
jgi:hypothetical protein